jgi:hypothetical protein
MKKMMFIFILLMVKLALFGQSLSINQGWSVTIPSSIVTEAGRNYTTTNVLSSTTQSLMDVFSSANSVATISVQKSDISWTTSLSLYLKRTGSGSGSTNFSVTNGTTSLLITNTPQYFFEVRPGSGTQVLDIPIQYEIRGLSVLIPVKTYNTTLLFTISN